MFLGHFSYNGDELWLEDGVGDGNPRKWCEPYEQDALGAEIDGALSLSRVLY